MPRRSCLERRGVQEERFTTTCNRPGCEASLEEGGPDPQRDELPNTVRCTKGHTFPMLERRTAPGGEHAYKLGPEDRGAHQTFVQGFHRRRPWEAG
jgi:hypothetical protein